jgi:hypothetical protein
MSVIIGIDPHKATHASVAIDRDEQPIATLEVWWLIDARPSGCWPGRHHSAANGPGRSRSSLAPLGMGQGVRLRLAT